MGDCRNSFFVFVSDRSRSGLAENLGQIPINKNCLFLPFLFFFMDSSTSTKPVPLFFPVPLIFLEIIATPWPRYYLRSRSGALKF